MEQLIRYIFIILGILGILDSLIVLSFSNFNLGNIFPGFAGCLFLFYGLFHTRIMLFTQSGVGKYMRFFMSFGFLFFIVTFLAITLTINSTSKKPPENGADAIIILGAGLNGDKVSKTLAHRLEKGAGYYFDNEDAIVVVSGGQGRDELCSEAYAMKQYLLEKGVPEKSILMEEKSTNTKENFQFSKILLDQLFQKDYNVVYVTNDFHVYRSGMLAKDCGLDAEGLGSPSSASMLPNYYVREYFSILKYYIFG